MNAESMLRPLRPCRFSIQTFWLSCFAAVSLAVALPLRRFEFNESYYQEPSGVFNPAAVWNPLVGWVVVFRWDRCFYQRCGIHHTETTVGQSTNDYCSCSSFQLCLIRSRNEFHTHCWLKLFLCVHLLIYSLQHAFARAASATTIRSSTELMKMNFTTVGKQEKSAAAGSSSWLTADACERSP